MVFNTSSNYISMPVLLLPSFDSGEDADPVQGGFHVSGLSERLDDSELELSQTGI
jgi:hypothetical protein